MTLYSTDELDGIAVQIATMIAKTDIDQRGQLYAKVAEQLRNRAQNYQASLFDRLSGVA